MSFTLDEFSTGAWIDRPEYRDGGINWEHIVSLHERRSDFVELTKCGETDVWFFLHLRGVIFEAFLYSRDGTCAEPVMWVYGTTFDGVREMSGGENFTLSLLQMSAALTWLQSCLSNKFPRFAEWYEDPTMI